MQRVAHERVCKLFEHRVLAGGLFGMVLELLGGGSLAERIADSLDGRVREFEVMQVAFDVLPALEFMHSKGMIHRDVKPSNIMRTTVDGRPVYKLIDLSISAIGVESWEQVSQTLQTGTTSLAAPMGTSHYMSPEQVRPGVAVTAQTDLWSLGVALFVALSGVLPFAPLETDRFKIARAIESDESAPDLAAVSDAVVALTMRALQKDPALRFSTAMEMAAELERMISMSGDEEYGLFISYRVWCDKDFAEALYTAASRCQLQPVSAQRALSASLASPQCGFRRSFSLPFAESAVAIAGP